MLNTVASYATIIGGLSVLVGLAAACFRSLRSVDRRLLQVEFQHQNNGGSTTRDAIDRIESTVNDLDGKLDAHLLEAAHDHTKLDMHLAAHLAQTPTVVVSAPPSTTG